MLAFQLAAVFAIIESLGSFAHGWAPISNTFPYRKRNVNEELSPYNGEGNWLGWGANVYNNRVASPRAKINTSNVASLHSTCQKEYSVGVSAAPLVVNGIAYFPTWGGLLVALDYSRCSVLWQINITDIVQAYKPVPEAFLRVVTPVSRTTPAIDGNVLFLGTLANALLLAVDRRDGKLIDTIQINDHPFAIVTMSPTAWHGRIFVGAASGEESAAALIPNYTCCSFVGNMDGLAFERNRFRLLWSQSMIPAGSNFSGAAIWGSQPAIDPTRNQVFVGTGNVYSVPPSYTACQNQTVNSTTSTQSANASDPCAPSGLYQETILAFDTSTGRINWFHELSPLDAWTVACVPNYPGASPNPGACPVNPGPDADFGMAPSFVPRSSNTPSKEDTIVVGQKNGNLYALSAESGALFWATATGPDGSEGGLIWGVAVDANAVYYNTVNTQRVPWKLLDGTKISNGAFGSLSLSTGKILWETPVPRNGSSFVIPTVVNDVVIIGLGGTPDPNDRFEPRGPGSLIPLNKHTGAVIEETVLDAFFQGGIAAVHDYALFGTGYNGRVNGSFNVWKICS